MCCLRSSLWKKNQPTPALLRLLSPARSQESIPYFQLGWNNLLKVSSSWCSYHLAPKMSALLAAATHSACELCMHYLSPLHRVLCFMRETGPIYQHPLYPSTAWRSTCCYSTYSQAAALSLLQITGRRDVDWLKQTNTQRDLVVIFSPLHFSHQICQHLKVNGRKQV